ncbi:S-adenosyl-L-methionine-dependent methyltransferase [Clathrospora elynae]|uniref:S-adenosyl-L-methionine-dependent methyltransferase n=1 Tax=Clathrospora elynae TaxID=706981 RepID=A0A6A5SPB9_9PLEO|nr:S-adenosyl-L-methionine-dependent methyltransferase [Clathrospora elynae]
MLPLTTWFPRKRKRESSVSILVSERDSDAIEVRPREKVAREGPPERPPLKETQTKGNAVNGQRAATHLQTSASLERLLAATSLSAALPQAVNETVRLSSCRNCRTRGGNRCPMVVIPKRHITIKENREPRNARRGAPIERSDTEHDGQFLENDDGSGALASPPRPHTRTSARPRRNCGRVSYVDSFLDDSLHQVPEVEDEDDAEAYISPASEDESEVDEVDEEDEDSVPAYSDSEASAHSGVDMSEEIMFEDGDLIKVDEPIEAITKTHRQKKTWNSSQSKAGKGADLSLPPLSNINDIFEDLTDKAASLGLCDALANLKGGVIHVATMCSGTESPLLALDLIWKALEQRGHHPVKIQHHFSAEIEVTKQGYIERNFRPKILYRDIRDFIPTESKTATTAYGAEETIPGGLHILIAGFVCKDLSRMNNHAKGLDSNGESGDTWRAVFNYADRYRPSIVLLENVKATIATWQDVVGRWDSIGYEAAWVFCDSKKYYLPQTRERMYMIAIERSQFGKNVDKAVVQWQDLMQKLQRQYSSPYEAFLADSLQEPSPYSILLSETDWDLCKLRYDNIRSSEKLGILRPITRWSENGTVRPPDFANLEWYTSQSSRVYDAIEVAHLQGARNGYDSLYKMAVWDVSQNVERFRAHHGIVSCITPGGCNFASNRQHALSGSQLLVLQGMPLDRLLFATETQRDLQDLAGNAMSTTVIGASLISAIISGWKSFHSQSSPAQTLPAANLAQTLPTNTTARTDLLKQSRLDPGLIEELDLDKMKQEAKLSARLCNCEGTKSICKASVRICSACEHTACTACAGNPRHLYNEVLPRSLRTQTPAEFINLWRSKLPARLKFGTFPDIRRLASDLKASDQNTKEYVDVVVEARIDAQYFCMGDFVRQDRTWKVTYSSPKATLELRIGNEIQWLLFVQCSRTVPGNSPLRKSLEAPIAQGIATEALLDPEWQLYVPFTQDCQLQMSSSSERTSSWRSRLGLPEYRAETVPTKIRVQSNAKNSRALVGEYEYLPHCGTASSSLYKRSTESDLWVYTVGGGIHGGCTRHVALRSEWQPHTEAAYRPQHPHS